MKAMKFLTTSVLAFIHGLMMFVTRIIYEFTSTRKTERLENESRSSHHVSGFRATITYFTIIEQFRLASVILSNQRFFYLDAYFYRLYNPSMNDILTSESNFKKLTIFQSSCRVMVRSQDAISNERVSNGNLLINYINF